MSDTRLRAGEFTLLDSVIEIAKSRCFAIWSEYCERAYQLTEGPTGLSKEEAGKKLLSVPRLEIGLEAGLKRIGLGPRLESTPNYMYKPGKLGALEDEIGKRVVDALKSGCHGVIKGYTSYSLDEQVAPPTLITPKALLDALNSGDLELRNGIKLSSVRLVMAEPVAPATPPPAVAPAPAPDVTAQAVAPQKYRSATDPTIHQKLMPVFEAACAEGDKISAREAAKRVRPQLNVDGYDASIRHIEQLGLQPQYNSVRRPPGITRSSKRRRHRAS